MENLSSLELEEQRIVEAYNRVPVAHILQECSRGVERGRFFALVSQVTEVGSPGR